MANEIEQSIQQKARELARKITVAHDLDPEIQEELYGHIEDKLLAYKCGEERISDEDAFILVREHFGDAKVIRGLLQEVHAGAVQVSLVRSLLALVIASLGVNTVVALLHSIVSPMLFLLDIYPAYLGYLAFTHGFRLLAFVSLLFVLDRWRRAVTTGGSPWYCHWSIGRMLRWLCMFAILSCALPNVLVEEAIAASATVPLELSLLSFAVSLLFMAGHCLLWLWWTSAISRRASHVAAIGLCWVAYTTAATLSQGPLVFYIGSSVIPWPGVFTFVQGQIGTTSFSGNILYLGPWHIATRFAAEFVAMHGLFALVCCLLLLSWRIFGRWRGPITKNSGLAT